eukprot:9063185-Ditylum_brightwellii.AAC.1
MDKYVGKHSDEDKNLLNTSSSNKTDKEISDCIASLKKELKQLKKQQDKINKQKNIGNTENTEENTDQHNKENTAQHDEKDIDQYDEENTDQSQEDNLLTRESFVDNTQQILAPSSSNRHKQ